MRQPSSATSRGEGFRELGVVFWLAVTLLEHGELIGDTALLDEAREIFEQLRRGRGSSGSRELGAMRR